MIFKSLSFIFSLSPNCLDKIRIKNNTNFINNKDFSFSKKKYQIIIYIMIKKIIYYNLRYNMSEINGDSITEFSIKIL